MAYSDLQNSIANKRKNTWIHIMWLCKGSLFHTEISNVIHLGADNKNSNFQSILKQHHFKSLYHRTSQKLVYELM